MSAPSFNWSAPASATTYLSTELNSLGSGSNKLGAAIDPSGFAAPNARAMAMMVEISMASFSPASGGYLNLWIVNQIDGTNYEDGGDSVDPQAGATVFTHGVLNGSSVARRIVFPTFVIPPWSFKLLIGNRTGAAFNAAGNTVKYTVFTPTFPTV